MVQLSGYQESELAVTFMARLPSEDLYSNVYLSDSGWHTENVSANRFADAKSLQLNKRADVGLPENYVLTKRVEQPGGKVSHVIEHIQLSCCC